MPRRMGAAVLLMVALTVLTPPLSAVAHAALVSSDPEDGSTLARLPDQVTLTFDEAVDEPAFVSVTAPDGSTVASGEAAVFDSTVSQVVAADDVTRGTFTISYRVTSLDGHPVTGSLTFNVGQASETAGSVAVPGPTESAGDSFISEHVASLTIAMAAITLAICLAILKAGRHRQQRTSDEPRTPSQSDAWADRDV